MLLNVCSNSRPPNLYNNMNVTIYNQIFHFYSNKTFVVCMLKSLSFTYSFSKIMFFIDYAINNL